MVEDLTERLFDGDVAALVSHLITEQEIDRGELARLQKLIESRRKGGQ
jgi:predicted transcriptional regulator